MGTTDRTERDDLVSKLLSAQLRQLNAIRMFLRGMLSLVATQAILWAIGAFFILQSEPQLRTGKTVLVAALSISVLLGFVAQIRGDSRVQQFDDHVTSSSSRK